MTEGTYPQTRLRRTRAADWSRLLVAEHRLSAHDLIWPLFVAEEQDTGDIASMPGVKRLTIAQAVEAAGKAQKLGIPAIALFPCTPAALKNESASEAFNPDNLVCHAIRAIKIAVPNIGIICDVALDPYTSHGQDGIVRDGVILNDETVELLCRQAVLQAQAGCDIIAPSDMMDGRIGAIRASLDAAGFSSVQILSYAVKYASAFYGPFRDAVGSRSALGKADKRSYQMDPANRKEALREVQMDVAEGADMLMVKPGMPYLDIIRDVREACNLPVLAYQVSGEYAMIRHAADAGALEFLPCMLESLLGFKRAGATAILTYAALEVAGYLAGDKA